MWQHPTYPDALVRCQDVAAFLDDGGTAVQVDLDPDAYAQGHIPGAIHWDWRTQLRNPTTNEALEREELEALMGQSGFRPNSPILLYGDNHNWFACWAIWLLHMFGHRRAYLLDGGIRLWIDGKYPLAVDESKPAPPASYDTTYEDPSSKATTEHIFEAFCNPTEYRLVDVRSTAEYAGEFLGPGPGMEATCQVGGHLPTAVNVPWHLNCNADGTFKSPAELRELYRGHDVNPSANIITYCAIGERASFTWFVLKHLLGYPVVMNYDRSMAHWSRLPNAPIELGRAA